MKTMKNMRWMAALALTASMIMACSTEDDLTEIENPANQHKVLTLTTTISMSDKADTRSIMTDTGSGITAEWEVGDKFYVSYGDEFYVSKSAQAQVISINPTTKDATITVDLVDPSDGDWITFKYPYEEGKNYQYNGGIIQSGTLDDIKDHYTRISGSGYLSVSGNTVSLPDGIEMEQRTAIWKLSFTDGTNDITKDITKLDISIGNYTTYQVAPSSLNVIYVALDDYETYGTKDYYFEATTATGVYVKSKSGIKLDGGKVYTSTGVALSPMREGNTVFLNYIKEYEAQDGEVLTGTAGENAHIKVADGATITINDANITAIPDDYSHGWAGITCLGDATIILSGTNTIKGGSGSYPGIYVPADKTLTIQGDGQLTVNSSSLAAGIGGGFMIDCGNIIIKGGDITTPSVIGSGNFGTCGDITIQGGDITTSGMGSGYSGTCGDITIKAGTINTTGLSTPAIGGNCGKITIEDGDITTSGIGSRSDGTCGDITIKGGTVNTTGQYSPGIGGNCGNITIIGGDITTTNGIGTNSYGTCGDITIGGGTINTTGIYSPGIGGNCGNITISGGDITSTGGSSSGIGSGSSGTCGNIIISGGSVTAIGDGQAAGIGGGSNANCLDITISGSSTIVNATGASLSGAGIGGGYQGNCGKIIIENGTITAIGGGSSAGIGGGNGSYSGDPSGTCDDITIHGGTITATGGHHGAGIGGGSYGNCGKITIEDGIITAIGGEGSAGIGGGYGSSSGDPSGTCDNIIIKGGNVTATGGQFAAGIGGGFYGNCNNINIEGGTVDATGKDLSAAIGGGWYGNCGDITITNSVNKITATRVELSSSPITIGKGNSSTCGTVTVGGTPYANGITTNPYTYQP